MPRVNNLRDSPLFARFQAMAKNSYFYPVLLAIVTVAVFWQVVGFEFVLYDDNQNVYQNPHLQSFTLQNIIHYWKNPDQGNMYLPVTKTVWAILAAFAKTTPSDSFIREFNPALFHAVNLVLHVFNVLLVFLILRVLIRDELACFLGALIFAIHPVQVEPVAWVTGLKDVLSGFFSLIALWQYLLYAKLSMKSPDEGGAGQHRVRENRDENKWKTLHYLVAVSFFLLALLSKPARIIVPIAAFILDYFILRRRLRDIALSLIGFIAITLPVMVLTIYLEHYWIRTAIDMSLIERFLIVSDSLVFYLYKLIVPISLGPDYGRTPAFVLSQNFIYFAWLIPVIVLIVICLIRKHRSWLLASAGIFIAGALPVLGFVQFQFQGISTVADRYLYVSMLGPGMALAFFLSRDLLSRNKKRLVKGMCGAVIVALGILSMRQTRYWENSYTFFTHALEVNPDSSAFHINLGIVLARQGKVDEAVSHYNEAIRLSPANSMAHVNLGIVLAQQGKVDEAVYQYLEAVKLSPDNAEAHTQLGVILAQKEKFDQAVFHFSEALKSDPNKLLARSNLGYVLAQQGKFDEAVFNLKEALRIFPHDSGAHTNLGIVLAQQGKFDEAIYHFTEALKINPADQDAYLNLVKARSLKK